MPTYGERVSADGVLRGRGHDAAAQCRVSATKISLGTVDFTYSEFVIERVSQPLSDGDYHLFALGYELPVRYRGGIWTWGGPP